MKLTDDQKYIIQGLSELTNDYVVTHFTAWYNDNISVPGTTWDHFCYIDAITHDCFMADIMPDKKGLDALLDFIILEKLTTPEVLTKVFNTKL